MTLRRYGLSQSLFSTLVGVLLLAGLCWAGHYANFEVSVYIVANTTRQLAQNPASIDAAWQRISEQVKVDKVYIESQRGRMMATDEELEIVKKFFLDHGVKVAGGTTIDRKSVV